MSTINQSGWRPTTPEAGEAYGHPSPATAR
jgi:hypothetical protein